MILWHNKFEKIYNLLISPKFMVWVVTYFPKQHGQTHYIDAVNLNNSLYLFCNYIYIVNLRHFSLSGLSVFIKVTLQ